MRLFLMLSTLLASLSFCGCGSDSDGVRKMMKYEGKKMHLYSRKFIPRDGSPQLSWSGEPMHTKSFAIIVDDFDANDTVHWAVFNIDNNIHEVDSQNTPIGSIVGSNYLGERAYANPKFPDTHRYVAHIYALDFDDITHLDGKDINNVLNKKYDHSEFEYDFREHILAGEILVSKPKGD